MNIKDNVVITLPATMIVLDEPERWAVAAKLPSTWLSEWIATFGMELSKRHLVRKDEAVVFGNCLTRIHAEADMTYEQDRCDALISEAKAAVAGDVLKDRMSRRNLRKQGRKK